MEFEFGAVDSIDNVPEQFRSLYTGKDDDGKLTVGEGFAGVASAITNLNKAARQAREDAKRRSPTDLSALSEWGEDPTSIATTFREKLADLEARAQKGEDTKAAVQRVRDEMVQAHQKEIAAKDARTQALQGQLYKLMVENVATAEIAEAKGDVELLMPFVREKVQPKEEDGQLNTYVVDDKGEIRYSTVTGLPMTIKELIGEFKQNPKYGRLFESESGPGGGGMPPGSGRRKDTQSKGKELTSTEKISAGLNNRTKRR